MERREKVFSLGFFETNKMSEKEGNSQIGPFYRVECENSLVVRLKPFTINGLDCPRFSTAEIKRPFEI